jgi:hypothetical protein
LPIHSEPQHSLTAASTLHSYPILLDLRWGHTKYYICSSNFFAPLTLVNSTSIQCVLYSKRRIPPYRTINISYPSQWELHIGFGRAQVTSYNKENFSSIPRRKIPFPRPTE